MRSFWWLLILLVSGLSGCSSREWQPMPKRPAAPAKQPKARSVGKLKEAPRAQDAQVGLAHQAFQGGQNNPPAAAPAAPVPRKIIFTASLELVVDQLDQAEQQLRRALKEQGGYIAQSWVTGSPGSPRSGTWTLRVPVEHFEPLQQALLTLGEMRENKVDSREITDEYYDLNVRIKNKQQEETRLLELLKKATGNLKDILNIEEHLTRVRGDIEQMQGQLQRWDKETTLATLTVVLHDRKGYVPPTAPAFGVSITRTFSGSVENLVSLGRGVCLLLVALVPWLPLLAALMVPLWWLRRRARRRPAVPPVGTV